MSATVFIGIPSNGDWKAEFGMSLAGLIARAGTPGAGNCPVIEGLRLWNARGSILPRSRTTLAQKALESGATHLLFLDSDMVFPPDTLHRLLSWRKSVVACNCPTKMLPSTPTARGFSETALTGVPLYSKPGDGGLEKVWRVGTGVMLVETRVFHTLPQPWFPITWDDKLQDYRGEDWSFVEALEKAGIPTWIDTRLSRQIGHVGDLRFEHSHVEIPNGL